MKVKSVLSVLAISALMLTRAAAAEIDVGDYVKMGFYNESEILWRCVSEDDNGKLLMSDEILTLKAFDAKGEHENDYRSYRKNHGSNLWETSNLRSWLNSDAEAGSVVWLCGNAPTASAVWGGYNAYDKEAGFLSGFTDTQKSAVKEVEQKQLLSVRDAVFGKKATGGTEPHISFSCTVENVLTNYDRAYFYTLRDKMFVPDIKQINEVYKNSEILGEKYYLGKLSAECAEKSEYKYGVKPGANWYSWLRTPYGVTINSETVRIIWTDANADRASAKTSYIGVRPAFYLADDADFADGEGTKENPFEIR